MQVILSSRVSIYGLVLQTDCQLKLFLMFSVERLCKVAVRVGEVFDESTFTPSSWKLCQKVFGCLPSGTTSAVDCSLPVSGRFVSVNLMMHLRKLNPSHDFLTLCELEVFQGKLIVLFVQINIFCLNPSHSDCFPCWPSVVSNISSMTAS